MHSLRNRIQFDKRKGIVGAVLGALVLLVCCLRLHWYLGIVFAAVFTLAGFVRLDIKAAKWQYLLHILWGIAMMVLTLLASTAMMSVVRQATISWERLLLNIACILIVCGGVYLITANWRISILAGSFLLTVLATANGFVYQFRGKELGATDILSAPTALRVAGQYRPVITPVMAYTWICWGLLSFGSFSLPPLAKRSRVWSRVIALVAEIALVAALWFGSADIPIKTWGSEGARINGFYLNFFLGIRDSAADKPANYTPQAVSDIAQKYMSSDTISAEKRPNILVIMNESYADLRMIGEGVQTSQPVTPFIDSLQENTIRGHALTSVYGGNTANAEFEFLTGHSMAFLPTNSVPYQQYVNGNISTLAWILDAYGYKSVATHPYFANGWSRNRIYPGFGFEDSTFIDSYPQEQLLREYVSDQEMFEYIMQMLDNKPAGDPMFLFGITMQNHGGYDYKGKNFVKTIDIEGEGRQYSMAEQYLTLLNETDTAMEYLLTALQDYPEDTIVLFFGDHFPNIENGFYELLHGGAFNTLEEQALLYSVPFFIWANYDIPEQTVAQTSLNYLAHRLLEAAGLALPPYQRFLADMEQVVPAMNAFGYFSLAQDAFVPYDAAEGEEAVWLNQYAMTQYNHLFDKKNRNKIFFEHDGG